MRRFALCIAAAVGVPLAACGGSSRKALPEGGAVFLDWGGHAMATLVTSAGTAAPEMFLPALQIPLGTCSTVVPSPVPSPATTQVLDAGPTLKLISGGSTITMTHGGSMEYDGWSLTTPIPENSDWDLVVSGTGTVKAQTVRGALHTPSKIHPILGNANLPSNGRFTVYWAPAEADFVVIWFYGTSLGPTCRVEDKGYFDLPADAANAVAPPNGGINYFAYSMRSAVVSGRSVQFVGMSTDGQPYTKPPM